MVVSEKKNERGRGTEEMDCELHGHYSGWPQRRSERHRNVANSLPVTLRTPPTHTKKDRAVVFACVC